MRRFTASTGDSSVGRRGASVPGAGDPHVAFRDVTVRYGSLVECGPTDAVFSDAPASRLTFDYVRGHFG